VGGGGGAAPLITLTTDFGLRDPFVGIVKGVIATRAPGVRVVDVTHGIPPQDVVAGALVLRHAVPYFPRGAVHVAVVDPGVGSARRALCLETDVGCFVGPDNGLLTLAAPPGRVRRAVVLTEERFFLSPRSATFHGRDVFAPVAAALATGTDVDALGPPCSDPLPSPVPEPVVEAHRAHGEVVYVDRFGNLTTNVPDGPLLRRARRVRVGDVTLDAVSPSYAAVPVGAPVAVVNSWGLLEIAVRDGAARTALGCGRGAPVVVEA
jgi:hypothetical protein